MASIFISHASEDNIVARPIADELIKRGHNVWFDEYILELGDSLSEKIDRGLHDCDYGIVILSNSFYGKNWTKKELAGLTSREMLKGKKFILPIWHQIDAETVFKYSPTMLDKFAANTNEDVKVLVDKIENVTGKSTYSFIAENKETDRILRLYFRLDDKGKYDFWLERMNFAYEAQDIEMYLNIEETLDKLIKEGIVPWLEVSLKNFRNICEHNIKFLLKLMIDS